MLKTTFQKLKPKTLIYRGYNTYSKAKLTEELSSSLENVTDFHEFERIVEQTLDSHAPKKKKFLRGNCKPYVSKELRKAMMKRSELKNKANKTKYHEDILNYKKQRNLVTKLNKNSKKAYFNSLSGDTSKKPFGK